MEEQAGRTGNGEAGPDLPTCFDDVFRIPLLQGKILNYAIYTKDGSKFSRADALSYRGVNHTWLEAVEDHLKRKGEALFKFECDGIFSPKIPAPSNSRFRKFLDACAVCPRDLDRIPPFELTLELHNNHLEETLPYLGQCFQFCSSGLIKLTLSFILPWVCSETDMSLLRRTFETMSLPVLKTLTVEFFYRDILQGWNSVNADIYMNLESTKVVQSLLNGSEQLKHFSLKSCTTNDLLPQNFKNIVLPSTLTTLKITKSKCSARYWRLQIKLLPSYGDTDDDSDILVRTNVGFEPLPQGMTDSDKTHLLEHNKLPKLTHLSVRLQNGEGTCIYQMMSNFAKSLQVLKISGILPMDQRIPTQPPWMKRLQRIHFPGRDSSWVEHYTKGDKEVLKPTKVDLLLVPPGDPMEASRFTAVEELVVKLENHFDPLRAKMSEKLHLLFPRITKLTLSMNGWGDSNEGLDYIFENMTLLEVLSISVALHGEWDQTHAHYCSSLLLGRSPQIVEMWEIDRNSPVSRRLWSRKPPVIVNLTKLRELTLSFHTPKSTLASNEKYLLSDAVFKFAFSRMPELQKIQLFGILEASPEEVIKWQDDNRIFQWEPTALRHFKIAVRSTY